VGEAVRDARRAEALVLPQRDDEQLPAGAVVTADEDDVAVDEVADVDRAARSRLARAGRRCVAHAPRTPRLAHPPRDLRLHVKPTQPRHDALAEAFRGVVGDGDRHTLRHAPRTVIAVDDRIAYPTAPGAPAPWRGGATAAQTCRSARHTRATLVGSIPGMAKKYR